MSKVSMVTVELVKGLSGRTQKQRACVRGLGLKKIRSKRTLAHTPEVAGMINKVSFMLNVVVGD